MSRAAAVGTANFFGGFDWLVARKRAFAETPRLNGFLNHCCRQ